MSRTDCEGRLKKLRAELDRRKVDALVVTHLPNVRYLCGFTGSAGVLLVARRPVFFTDGRYAEQAAAQVQDARVSIVRGGTLAAVAATCAKLGLKRVAIESEHLTVAQLGGLEQALGKGVKLVRLEGAVESPSRAEGCGEIVLLRKAVDYPLAFSIPCSGPCMWGSRIRDRRKTRVMARKAGAERMSFETIVASANARHFRTA